MLAYLTGLKDFLADRPEWAFLALSVAANIALFRMYVKAQNARLADTLRWLPIAEKMSALVTQVTATCGRRRSRRTGEAT